MKNLFAIVLLVTAVVVTGCEKKPAPPATPPAPPANTPVDGGTPATPPAGETK